jgi:hypothetical protein
VEYDTTTPVAVDHFQPLLADAIFLLDLLSLDRRRPVIERAIRPDVEILNPRFLRRVVARIGNSGDPLEVCSRVKSARSPESSNSSVRFSLKTTNGRPFLSTIPACP